VNPDIEAVCPRASSAYRITVVIGRAQAYLHDATVTDKRNPRSNRTGDLGATETRGQGTVYRIRSRFGRLRGHMPCRYPQRSPPSTLDVFRWLRRRPMRRRKDLGRQDPPHSLYSRRKVRVWYAARICQAANLTTAEGSDIRRKVFRRASGRADQMYDPKTKVHGSSHRPIRRITSVGFDANNTLWQARVAASGAGRLAQRQVVRETGDEGVAGWTPFILDTTATASVTIHRPPAFDPTRIPGSTCGLTASRRARSWLRVGLSLALRATSFV